MGDDIRRLQDLTRILLDAELATLQHLSDEARLKQEAVHQLGAAQAERAAALKAGDPLDDLAFRFGQDARWQAWAADAKGRLVREAAECAARREAQRKRAQRAFGRVEALAGLQRMEDEERKLRDARRLHTDPNGAGQTG